MDATTAAEQVATDPQLARTPALSRASAPAQSQSSAIAGTDVVDLVVGELLHGVLRLARSNPTLLIQLGEVLALSRDMLRAPLLVSKGVYAERLSYSTRKLDQLIEAGLPTVGKGRALRIPMQEADAWVLSHLRSGDDEGDVEFEALVSARRRARRSRLQ